jgi:hypothetical protein
MGSRLGMVDHQATAKSPSQRQEAHAGDAQLAHLYDRARGELRRWMLLAPFVESWIPYERALIAAPPGHGLYGGEETICCAP